MALAAACALAIITACASSSNQASSPTVTTAPPTTAVTTTAVTTTSAPRTALAKGTIADVPASLLPGPPEANGWVTVHGEATWSGDLVGKEAYTTAFSPADAAGVIIARSDVTVTGTLVGVGEGSFSWHEADRPAADVEPSGSAPVVGVSGVFVGATGTLSWGVGGDTYELDLVWT